MKKIFLIATVALAFLSSCSTQKSNENSSLTQLDPAKFEATLDGKAVKLYTLKNANGMEVAVTSFGARLVSIMVPAKDGKMTEVSTMYRTTRISLTISVLQSVVMQTVSAMVN